MAEWKLPLSDLSLDSREEGAILRVLRSGWISTGPETAAFEREFAAAVDTRHAVAVSNGTAALHLALVATGATAGSEIIQPALNFVSAANMTTVVGAEPVFADVSSLDDPTISPASVADLLTPRTHAVVPMHYGGQAADVAALLDLTRASDVMVIEDACHALGGRYRGATSLAGRPVGASGRAGCYSFFSNKNVTCGEGGMVATDDSLVAEHVRRLRSHGMTSMSWDRYKGHAAAYTVVEPGLNYRIDDLRAAFARVQLDKLPANVTARRRLTAAYRSLLADVSGWRVPFCDLPIEDSAAHIMVALAPDTQIRDEARRRLADAAIQTSLHYPCVADFEPFQRCRSDGLPVTREFVSRALTLPLFPTMTQNDVEIVVETIASTN